MPTVYTQFNRPKTIPVEPGNNFLNVYQEEILKDGTKGLVCTGKKNVYAMIQEELEASKIENIMKAVAQGDLSRLRTEQPTYIDATTFPKTLMEANNIVLKAKQEFEKMPDAVKKEFNYDSELYVSMMGTKEYLEKMAPYNKYLNDVKAAGTLKEYNKKVADQAKFEKDVEAAKGVTNES